MLEAPPAWCGGSRVLSQTEPCDLKRKQDFLVSSGIFRHMDEQKKPRTFWPALVLVAGLPRIIGDFMLPNAFGDAYVYIRVICDISTQVSRCNYTITYLIGYW